MLDHDGSQRTSHGSLPAFESVAFLLDNFDQLLINSHANYSRFVVDEHDISFLRVQHSLGERDVRALLAEP